MKKKREQRSVQDELVYTLDEMVKKFAYHSETCPRVADCSVPCGCGYVELFEKIQTMKKILGIR